MTLTHPPTGGAVPPPANKHSVRVLVGCVALAVAAGAVTNNWPTAVTVFLAAVALFK